MTPRRLVVLAFSMILTSQSLLTVTAQSPSNSASRGKNGRAQERKTDEGKREAYGTAQPAPRSGPQESRADKNTDAAATPLAAGDSLKLAVDLVVLDAQVIQQKTGRVIGDLKKDDFVLSEDGVKQQILHFSQDTLPLSVILLIDRGGCLDPFSEKVRHATEEALQRLRAQDEVALMAFADTTDLIAGFGKGKDRILQALNRVPPHDENAGHCFNQAFFDAADYMRAAGNPDGRRVIIVITGLTTYFDCATPTPQEARMAILESGSVVCGIVPKTAEQQFENGIMRTAAGIGGLFKAKSSSLKQLAEETGGEVLIDKPEVLDHTFNTLIDHLRTRYALGFVSTNRKRDGTLRKLKLELAHPPAKREERLVVKTKRGYVAAKESGRGEEKPRTR
ncbi:MAG TPA: VWA domain-containing protein [Blastocatellia bacterium]|nr:VWA domain-containing protein [Blastocatellia bacterium]